MNNISTPKNYYKRNKGKVNNLSKLFSKILLSIIFILSSLIFTNLSQSNYRFFKDKIINQNFKYPKLNRLYEKYFGQIIPQNSETITSVFNASLSYKNIEKFKSLLSIFNNWIKILK